MKSSRVTCGLLAACAGLAMVACESTPEQASRPARVIPELESAKRPLTVPLARAGGPVGLDTTTALVGRQRLTVGDNGPARVGLTTIEPGQGQGAVRHVKYSVRDAAATDVIRVLVGEMLTRSYIIDPKLAADPKQTVTMDIDAEMTQEDLRDLVEALASVQGWTLEKRGEITAICPGAEMPRMSAAPLLESNAMVASDALGMRVFRLRYMAVNDVAKTFEPLMSEGAKAVVVGRTMLVIDRIRQLNKLAKIVAAMDVPAFEGAEVLTFELAHEKPAEAAKILGAMAQGAGMSSQNDASVTFTPLARTNRLMVIARDPSLVDKISDWVYSVDVAPGSAQRQKYLYHIQFFDAAKLQTLLRLTFAERLERGGADGAPAAAGGAMDYDTGMRLVVDQEEDLLIVYGTPQDYADVMAVLQKVDVPRQQVMVQALIAEVQLNDSLQFGVEYFLQTDVGGSTLGLIGNLAQLGPPAALATGSAFLIGSDGYAIVRALQRQTNVNVIQAPRLFARDKDTASFQFGGEVPIVTSNIDSSVQDQGTTGIRQNITYKDTGTILEIQPKLSETGEVTLNVKLEIRDVLPGADPNGVGSPQFTVRKVTTTAVIPHGATLLLGGIITDKKTKQVGKIPILGDVPILGLAFQNTTDASERSELMLAITPDIVNDPGDIATGVTDFLRSAAGVEAALRAFDGELPADLASAVDTTGRVRTFGPGAAPADPAPAPAGPAPTGEPKPPPATPVRDAPGAGAALGLTRLAMALPNPESEESRAVAEFLSGLTTAALGGRAH